MQRFGSLVVLIALMTFLTFPLLGMVLWAAVFVFGYTPPFWLALVVVVGVVLNFFLMVGRWLHPSYRPR